MRIRYVLAVLALLLIAAGAFLAYYLQTLGPRLKQRVVAALADRFDADVQLADLQVAISHFHVSMVKALLSITKIGPMTSIR